MGVRTATSLAYVYLLFSTRLTNSNPINFIRKKINLRNSFITYKEVLNVFKQIIKRLYKIKTISACLLDHGLVKPY